MSPGSGARQHEPANGYSHSRLPWPATHRLCVTTPNPTRQIELDPPDDKGSRLTTRSTPPQTRFGARRTPSGQAAEHSVDGTNRQISIDLPARTASRGFLPWRLSNAGPRARGTFIAGPASETLHNCGLLRCTPRCKRVHQIHPRAFRLRPLSTSGIEGGLFQGSITWW